MARKRRLSVQPTRKDGGRVFVKRPDPHEEALMILKGQMSHAVAAPGTQVRGKVKLGPDRMEGKGESPGEPQKPDVPISVVLMLPPSRRPTCCPLSTLFFLGRGDRCPERPWP